MSDLERVGVELYIDGINAFQQGFDDATTAIDNLGSTAVDIDDKLQQLIDIMSETADTGATELAPALMDTSDSAKESIPMFAGMGEAMLAMGAVAADVGGGALQILADGVETVGNAIAGLVTGGLAVAGAALIAFAGGVATGALDAEKSALKIDQLTRQLDAMGDNTDITIEQVNQLASEFAVLAGGSDDVVIAIEQIAISSQAVSSEALPDFIQASLDLGAVMGDNAAGARILAKAYDQPSSAIGILEKQNIKFTEAQEKQIKDFEKAGDNASALAIVMGVLSDATGGAALANATTLSGAWGIFTNTIGEAFEEMGANFLPLMQTVGAFIISDVVPAVQAFGTAISGVISDIVAGDLGAATDSIREGFAGMLPPKVIDMLAGLTLGVRDFVDFTIANIPAMQQTFSDVFNAISVATFALVSVWDTSLAPAINTLFTALFGQAPTAQEAMTGMLDAISVGAGNLAIWVTTVLVPAVQSFSAWIVNDFTPAAVGLQTWLSVNIPIAIQATTDFWNNTLMPALSTVWAFTTTTLIPAISDMVTWLSVNVPPAIQAASDFFNNVLLPALTSAYDYTMTTLIPGIQSLAENLSVTLTSAAQVATDIFNNVLLPAFTAVQSFIADPLTPLVVALGGVFGELARIGSEILALAFNEVVLPAMTAVNDFVRDNITPVLTDLGVAVSTQVSPAMNDFKTGVLDPMSGAFTAIGDAVNGLIGWLDSLTTALGNIHIPANLTPGSPTPFELGLRGISSAIGDVTTRMQTLSSVNSAFEPIQLTSAGLAGGGVSGISQRVPMSPVGFSGGNTYNTNVSVQASYPRYTSPAGVFSDITQGLNRARA